MKATLPILRAGLIMSKSFRGPALALEVQEPHGTHGTSWGVPNHAGSRTPEQTPRGLPRLLPVWSPAHHDANSELSPLSFQLPPAGSSVTHKTKSPVFSTLSWPPAWWTGSALPILNDSPFGGPDWIVRAE